MIRGESNHLVAEESNDREAISQGVLCGAALLDVALLTIPPKSEIPVVLIDGRAGRLFFRLNEEARDFVGVARLGIAEDDVVVVFARGLAAGAPVALVVPVVAVDDMRRAALACDLVQTSVCLARTFFRRRRPLPEPQCDRIARNRAERWRTYPCLAPYGAGVAAPRKRQTRPSGSPECGGLAATVPRKVREVIRLLEKDGWFLARHGKTSHRKFQHPSKPNTVVVSGNSGEDMALGTYRSILKQAGLK